MEAAQQESGTTLSNVPLSERAYRIRRNALKMAAVQGQGYIAQALDIADVLAVAYFHALRYRPDDPHWEAGTLLPVHRPLRHRALRRADRGGHHPEHELETYGTDDSRLPMSGMASYTPGMEITGGSLAHGLGIAVGMALGLKRKSSNSSFTICCPTGSWTRARREACNPRPLATEQPDRPRRRQQPASRWSFDKRAQLRATRPEMGGVRLAYPTGRRQRHGRFGAGVR